MHERGFPAGQKTAENPGLGRGPPGQGPVSRKSRELFGPEKPFVKLRPAYSVKLVFLYVVKGIKIKITAKFRASRRLRLEDTKKIMSPEIRPKSLGTFEKRAPGLRAGGPLAGRGLRATGLLFAKAFKHSSSLT